MRKAIPHINLDLTRSAVLVALCGLFLGEAIACEARGDLKQICGVQSPEDLEVLPESHDILISEMAGAHGEPGRFAYLDARNDRLHEVVRERSAVPDWGDPACQERSPEQLSPHGIHLSPLPDGRWLLLAINHGDRESVQAFDVTARGDEIRFAWRGCVDTDYNFNDVAATPDGFIATHQFDKARGEGSHAEQFLFGGANTGFAVRWRRSGGFEKVPGTDAAFPNGISVSSDGKTAWMAATTGREVRKIDLIRNAVVQAARLPLAPDNLSWSAGGDLLVTGALDVHQLVSCANHEQRCPVPFAVARIDPSTLRSHIIFRNDGRLLLGASVAVIADNHIYIGSFSGDHLLQAPAPLLPHRSLDRTR